MKVWYLSLFHVTRYPSEYPIDGDSCIYNIYIFNIFVYHTIHLKIRHGRFDHASLICRKLPVRLSGIPWAIPIFF